MNLFRAIAANVLSVGGGALSVGASGYKYAFALTLILAGGFITGCLAAESDHD